MNRNILHIGLVLLAAPLLAAGCQVPGVAKPAPKPVACTMEAKLCPDGSAVGRVGPSCEFAPCPTPPKPSGSCSGPGDTSCPNGTQCIQDCGPPVVREDSPPAPYHCVDNAIAKQPRMCPICLASNTLIATPSGDVSVRNVTAGMQVWSRDSRGSLVSSTVVRVSSTPVPATHQVVHLVLSDKREAWVSPGHPTADGRMVNGLHAGDAYDAATVVSADLVPYWDGQTYDLLPDSDTGTYWANGILLGSTLSR